MQESIIIRNFGPIKDIEIKNISPFTVFIGESGSGKSTVMKVIVLFRWIYKMVNIRSYLKHANITESPFKFDFNEYLKNGGFEKEAYISPNTEIIYRKGNNEISYRGSLNTTIIIPEKELSLEKMSFIADKRNLIPDILAAQKITAKKKDISIDDTINFFLRETYNDFAIASKPEYVKELDIAYLGVKYISKETSAGVKYYIENIDTTKNYEPIKLENASSGMQTVTPLSVIVEYFAKHYNFSKFGDKSIFKYLYESDNLKKFNTGLNIGDIKHKNIHIHIEEPELSLYPESQRSLVNFIVNRCFIEKHNDYNMTVMLATHSPYIINHLNLLIKAYDKDKLIEGAKINYDDLSVYQVDEGKIYDLKIKNKKLIYTNPLSDTINAIYDEYERL
jgi:predicted ATP-dependent endonuclease of OLD family